jgi:hypothetical protein
LVPASKEVETCVTDADELGAARVLENEASETRGAEEAMGTAASEG